MFAPPGQDQEWQPPVDIYQASWGWILKFELAGVRMEDLNVHVSKRTVTVSGIRRDYMVETGCSHYSMEITYSRLRRSVQMPDDLNGREDAPGLSRRNSVRAHQNKRGRGTNERRSCRKYFPYCR